MTAMVTTNIAPTPVQNCLSCKTKWRIHQVVPPQTYERCYEFFPSNKAYGEERPASYGFQEKKQGGGTADAGLIMERRGTGSAP